MILLYQIYDKKANPFVIFAGSHGDAGAAAPQRATSVDEVGKYSPLLRKDIDFTGMVLYYYNVFFMLLEAHQGKGWILQ